MEKRGKNFTEQLRAQRFQSVFFPYLTLFQGFVDGMECGSLRGRCIFSVWNVTLPDLKRPFANYGPFLENYFNYVRTLLKFIQTSFPGKTEEDQRQTEQYLDLLQAQLTEQECLLLDKFCKGNPEDDLSSLAHTMGLSKMMEPKIIAATNATMDQGVPTPMLPKSEKVQPGKIAVSK